MHSYTYNEILMKLRICCEKYLHWVISYCILWFSSQNFFVICKLVSVNQKETSFADWNFKKQVQKGQMHIVCGKWVYNTDELT